ncbi:MAG: hypothetical protein JNK97_10590 [Zoogloea sp.]|nr:hypothetical protein [Zoogloea sp.]
MSMKLSGRLLKRDFVRIDLFSLFGDCPVHAVKHRYPAVRPSKVVNAAAAVRERVDTLL